MRAHVCAHGYTQACAHACTHAYTHVYTCVRTHAVVDHDVLHLPVAHPLAVTRALHYVRRRRHVLLPSGNDQRGIAALDGLRGQHDRLEAAAADLVDCHRGHLVRQPRMYCGLPRRILPEARGQNVAHDHFIHL